MAFIFGGQDFYSRDPFQPDTFIHKPSVVVMETELRHVVVMPNIFNMKITVLQVLFGTFTLRLVYFSSLSSIILNFGPIEVILWKSKTPPLPHTLYQGLNKTGSFCVVEIHIIN